MLGVFFNSRDESKKKKGIKIIRKMVSEEVQSFIGVQSKFWTWHFSHWHIKEGGKVVYEDEFICWWR